MALPRLLHPIDVDVSRIDKTTTVYDEYAREAIQQAARHTTVTISGQLNWNRSQGIELENGGVQLRADGYVLFRKYDLDAASFEVQEGDRFAKFGHLDTDVYVVKVEWMGHYPDQDGASLLKAYFEDREPTKQVGKF